MNCRSDNIEAGKWGRKVAPADLTPPRGVSLDCSESGYPTPHAGKSERNSLLKRESTGVPGAVSPATGNEGRKVGFALSGFSGLLAVVVGGAL